jgi:hypothetical protein
MKFRAVRSLHPNSRLSHGSQLPCRVCEPPPDLDDVPNCPFTERADDFRVFGKLDVAWCGDLGEKRRNVHDAALSRLRLAAQPVNPGPAERRAGEVA